MSDYVLQWESPHLGYYWIHHFVRDVYNDGLVEKYTGFQEDNFLVDCRANLCSFYLHKDCIKKVQEVALGFWKNRKKVLKWVAAIFRYRRVIDELPWQVSFVDSNSAVLFLKKLEEIFHSAVALHLVSQPHLTHVLREELVSCNVSDDDIGRFTLPVKLSPIMEEQFYWYTLVVMNQGSTSDCLNDAINKHLERWRFISAGDSRGPMSFEYLLDRFNGDSLKLSLIKEQLENLKKIKNGSLRRQLDKDSEAFPKNVRDVFKMIRDVSYLRFVTKQMWMKIWYLMEETLRFLIHGDPAYFDWTLEEFAQKKHLLSDERSTYIYLRQGNDKESLFYNQLDNFWRESLVSDLKYESINELSGDIGYRGRVVGRVLRVGWEDDIGMQLKNIQENTVLVLPQTTPSIVGILTRCKGLVTDEGGITGHASIVSRELKLPCVVGTRIATKVFKNGDIVEVDAFNGKVKLVSRERDGE